MSTRISDDTADGREPSSEPEGVETIESYEIDDGVVFYDAENPLAWVETSQTLTLEDVI
ncbi:hypothetical protein G6M89_21320 [Natronolimnobius sp. AArcel1]|uniref:DUF7331 family protein n=1 Tax=Natronolimnobius sp. AArcel1 TaxID=1679093 RepID=UPI0013EA6413|nr:hypothetical protein [Natronolimnobius sp. AArcel1]NGM71491.1 hypothetical protein [Natronolimnobius sp. AArcel1]